MSIQIIDSLYEDLIAQLTAENRIRPISLKLLSLQTNNERVLFVYKLIDNINAFPTIVDVEKNESVSIYYRNLGNKCFQKSEDFKAWQYYNLSLLFAPYASESFNLALANRSAVFFSLEKYNECINDIDKVLTSNYPEKLREKLNKRKTSCKVKLSQVVEDKEDASKLLLLESSQTPRFPCASPKIEVVFTKEMGRHVIAKSDIKVGEVLVQEQPYFRLLLKSQYLFACSYCLSRNVNLLPCPSCCFALYCSVDCKENAWKEYHKVECKLMPTIIDMQFTKLEFLALRTVVKARNDCSNWKNFFNTIEQADKTADTQYRGHVRVNNEWVYDSKYYNSIHTLSSNIELRSISDIFQKAVTAAVFLYMLMKKTDFLHSNNEEEREKVKSCVSRLLLHHIMTSPTNMHGISTNIQSAEGNFVDELSLASAPYAFHSLLNHSCAPNVVRFSKLGTGLMTLIALRPIKKGMQLFDNYGAHHALQNRSMRQGNLKFQYKFTCLCEACINDWPTYLSLKPARNLPVKLRKHKENLLNSDAIEKLQKGDATTAEKLFQPFCVLAEELEPYTPCKEQADCQESLKQCVEIFLGIVPYGYSKLVEWNAVPPKL